MKPKPAKRLPGDADRMEPMRWAREAHAVDDVLGAMNGWIARRRRTRRLVLGGATMLAVCAAIWSVQPFQRAAVDDKPVAGVVVTLPERRVLPDGSIATLKAGAEIEVNFGGNTRAVVLRRGEAHFEVMKNERQPFVVGVGAVGVRAVGTAFSVLRSATAMEVLVTEGRVAVEDAVKAGRGEVTQAVTAYAGAGELASVTLEGGEGSRVAPSVTTLSATAMAERLAWQVAQLEFSGTPLGEVIEALNRHAAAKLVLLDRELAGLRISGALRADNTDTLLRLLAEDYGIRAEVQPGGEIGLSKAR